MVALPSYVPTVLQNGRHESRVNIGRQLDLVNTADATSSPASSTRTLSILSQERRMYIPSSPQASLRLSVDASSAVARVAVPAKIIRNFSTPNIINIQRRPATSTTDSTPIMGETRFLNNHGLNNSHRHSIGGELRSNVLEKTSIDNDLRGASQSDAAQNRAVAPTCIPSKRETAFPKKQQASPVRQRQSGIPRPRMSLSASSPYSADVTGLLPDSPLTPTSIPGLSASGAHIKKRVYSRLRQRRASTASAGHGILKRRTIKAKPEKEPETSTSSSDGGFFDQDAHPAGTGTEAQSRHYSTRHLSTQAPEYGPTLKVHKSADKFILGQPSIDRELNQGGRVTTPTRNALGSHAEARTQSFHHQMHQDGLAHSRLQHQQCSPKAARMLGLEKNHILHQCNASSIRPPSPSIMTLSEFRSRLDHEHAEHRSKDACEHEISRDRMEPGGRASDGPKTSPTFYNSDIQPTDYAISLAESPSIACSDVDPFTERHPTVGTATKPDLRGSVANGNPQQRDGHMAKFDEHEIGRADTSPSTTVRMSIDDVREAQKVPAMSSTTGEGAWISPHKAGRDVRRSHQRYGYRCQLQDEKENLAPGCKASYENHGQTGRLPVILDDGSRVCNDSDLAFTEAEAGADACAGGALNSNCHEYNTSFAKHSYSAVADDMTFRRVTGNSEYGPRQIDVRERFECTNEKASLDQNQGCLESIGKQFDETYEEYINELRAANRADQQSCGRDSASKGCSRGDELRSSGHLESPQSFPARSSSLRPDSGSKRTQNVQRHQNRQNHSRGRHHCETGKEALRYRRSPLATTQSASRIPAVDTRAAPSHPQSHHHNPHKRAREQHVQLRPLSNGHTVATSNQSPTIRPGAKKAVIGGAGSRNRGGDDAPFFSSGAGRTGAPIGPSIADAALLISVSEPVPDPGSVCVPKVNNVINNSTSPVTTGAATRASTLTNNGRGFRVPRHTDSSELHDLSSAVLPGIGSFRIHQEATVGTTSPSHGRSSSGQGGRTGIIRAMRNIFEKNKSQGNGNTKAGAKLGRAYSKQDSRLPMSPSSSQYRQENISKGSDSAHHFLPPLDLKTRVREHERALERPLGQDESEREEKGKIHLEAMRKRAAASSGLPHIDSIPSIYRQHQPPPIIPAISAPPAARFRPVLIAPQFQHVSLPASLRTTSLSTGEENDSKKIPCAMSDQYKFEAIDAASPTTFPPLAKTTPPLINPSSQQQHVRSHKRSMPGRLAEAAACELANEVCREASLSAEHGTGFQIEAGTGAQEADGKEEQEHRHRRQLVDDELDRTMKLAREIVREACSEESVLARKQRLISMGQLIVETCAAARDSARAAHEARLAGRRAEIANALCLRSVQQMAGLAKEWRSEDGTYNV